MRQFPNHKMPSVMAPCRRSSMSAAEREMHKPMDPDARRIAYGKVRPMEEPGLLARLFGL